MILGIDIGGTKTMAGVVTRSGDVLAVREAPTPAQAGRKAILENVIRLGRALLAEYPDVQTVGIGSAGQVDSRTGTVRFANDNIPGWTGTPIGAVLHEAFDLPVWVDNDVNAMAIGESTFGAGRDYQHILYVAIGTGIGGAIVLNGSIWRGAHHGAGEIGYFPVEGQRTIEQVAAGPALAAAYQRATGTALTLREVAARAAQGDTVAREAIQRGAKRLGCVLAALLAALDPEVLIVGGGVPNIGALWWESFEAALRDCPLPVMAEVVPARYNTQAVMIGAACLTLNEG